MKRVLILGATGSIGTSALDVVRTHRGDFEVAGLAARRSEGEVRRLAGEFGAPWFCGEDSAERAVRETEADLVLIATVGLSGLAPALAAIERGMDIALATKEVMVAAGELVTARARERGVKILPVDSEHSAIFQCLQENAGAGWNRSVETLTLTASGGPFLDGPEDLAGVTPEQALKHPRWDMGRKVTVDSATMMNKGFEILEARWLFDVPAERIGVVVHPESTVHSLVTFDDGSTLAQLSPPDMRVPIQYAFSWPGRLRADRERLDLAKLGALHFREPDEVRFPCLRLAKEAAAAGGVKTAALSAADEVAVERFLGRDIGFTDIPRLLAEVVERTPDQPCDTIERVMAADKAARRMAEEWKR